MLSERPKYCELIACGRKTIDIRKTAPEIDTPFICYIYQTKRKWIYRILEKLGLYQGKIIGEFICDKVKTYWFYKSEFPVPAYEGDPNIWEFDKAFDITCGELEQSCLTSEELAEYGKGRKRLYGLHISNVIIYDKPKELGEFRKPQPTKCFLQQHTIDNTRPCAICPVCTIHRPPQSWCYVDKE